MLQASPHRVVLLAALVILAIAFSCKCPSSEPKAPEPPAVRSPQGLKPPKVLEPGQVKHLRFREKYKLVKQRPFLPPGVGRPGARSPSSAPAQPATSLPAGAADSPAGSAATTPEAAPARAPGTKSAPPPTGPGAATP